MSTAPIYYFNGIDFNSSFFQSSSSSSSSSASLNQLKQYFIDKTNETNETTVTGEITFNSNPVTFNALDMDISAPIKFYDELSAHQSSIFNDGTTLYIDTKSNNFKVTSGSTTSPTNLLLLSSSSLQFPKTLKYNYTTAPTYTSAQIGYSYGSNTIGYTGNRTTLGSFSAYGSGTLVPLPIGTYIININSALGGVGTANLVCSSFVVGYSLGLGTSSSANPKFPLFTSSTYIFSSINANYNFSHCAVVNVTANNSYLGTYSIVTLSAYVGGSLQSGISSYSVVRIA